jgi:hypothetical protein
VSSLFVYFFHSFFFFISSFSKLFPLSQAASVATLPSAVFVERLSLGARWGVLDSVGAATWESTSTPLSRREVGPGLGRSHLISAVELGCLDTISLAFSFAPFSFFLPFLLFHREIFAPGSLRNDDRELRRPPASPFCEEFFTLGHGAHRFLAIVQWFIHLPTHPQTMQQDC